MTCQVLFSRKNKKTITGLSFAEFANSRVNDKMAHYKPSHLALHCLLKRLTLKVPITTIVVCFVFC